MEKIKFNSSDVKRILDHGEMKKIKGGYAPDDCATKGKYCGSDKKCCAGLTCDSGEEATCIVLP